MVDGVHFGEHTCVVALGIDIDGTKHPLAVEQGSTENATLVTGLITGLRDRGLDTGKPVLAVLDGAKALSKAVKDVFDKPVIQRCQQHKIRNVIDRLPDKLRSVTEKRMRQAYHAESALKAEAELEALARELDKTHPGAAASLRESITCARRSGSSQTSAGELTARLHRRPLRLQPAFLPDRADQNRAWGNRLACGLRAR
jgi:putative transposase